MRLQVNGFRNELTDVIILGNLSGLTPDKNPGVITVNGAESIIDVVVTKNISGFLNFTYQDSKGKNLITHNSGKVPGVAKVKGNAGITVHLEDLFTINLGENWVGTRPVPRTRSLWPGKRIFSYKLCYQYGKTI